MTNIEFKVANGYRKGMIQLPKRMTSGSNGYDFYSCSTLLVPSHNEEPVFVPTGVTASFDPDAVLLLFNRSSNPPKRGLVLANGVGVVDSDYYQAEHNDIQGMFYNLSNKDHVIHSGDRIMQGIFTKTLLASNGGTSTDTREGGFGSTDEGNHSKVVQDLLSQKDFKEMRASKIPQSAGQKAVLCWANKYITEPRILRHLLEQQAEGALPKEISFDWMKGGQVKQLAKFVLEDALEESNETPEALQVRNPAYDKNFKVAQKFANKLTNKVVVLRVKGMI